jgi:hypothetical protein
MSSSIASVKLEHKTPKVKRESKMERVKRTQPRAKDAWVMETVSKRKVAKCDRGDERKTKKAVAEKNKETIKKRHQTSTNVVTGKRETRMSVSSGEWVQAKEKARHVQIARKVIRDGRAWTANICALADAIPRIRTSSSGTTDVFSGSGTTNVFSGNSNTDVFSGNGKLSGAQRVTLSSEHKSGKKSMSTVVVVGTKKIRAFASTPWPRARTAIVRSTAPACTIVLVAAAPCGSDTPVVGQPYATISAAIVAAGPGTLTVPVLVLVAPGVYPAFALPSYCYIKGSGYSATYVDSVTLDLTSWNTNDPKDPLSVNNPLNTHKAGIQDVGVTGTALIPIGAAFDLYAAPLCLIALVYLTNVRLESETLWRTSRPLQQLLMIGCDLEGDVVQKGGGVFWQGNSTAGSIDVYTPDINPAVTLDESQEGKQHSTLYLYDGAQIGTDLHVRFTNTLKNGKAYQMTGVIDAFSCANDISNPTYLPVLGVTGNGVAKNTNVYCSAIGIPEASLVSATNKGVILNTTFANAIGYVASEKCQWNTPAPRTVQEALDRIAHVFGPF